MPQRFGPCLGQTRLAFTSTLISAAPRGADLLRHQTPGALAPSPTEAVVTSLRLEAQLLEGGLVCALLLQTEARSPSTPCTPVGAGKSCYFSLPGEFAKVLGSFQGGGQVHKRCLGYLGAHPASPGRRGSLEIRLCLGLASRWAREPLREATCCYQMWGTPSVSRARTLRRGEQSYALL